MWTLSERWSYPKLLPVNICSFARAGFGNYSSSLSFLALYDPHTYIKADTRAIRDIARCSRHRPLVRNHHRFHDNGTFSHAIHYYKTQKSISCAASQSFCRVEMSPEEISQTYRSTECDEEQPHIRNREKKTNEKEWIVQAKSRQWQLRWFAWHWQQPSRQGTAWMRVRQYQKKNI